MKRLLTTLALVLSATYLFAQCKPDIEKVDKITKEKMKAWEYELYVTSFSGSVGGADEFGINVIIGQTGDKYEIDIQMTKYEFNEKKANFETKIKASKGSTVLFGFKEGGTPLTFTATEVQNASKAMKSLSGKEMYVTKVTMACYFTKEEMTAFKESLTTKTIDAFRATLDDGMILERSVKDKRGDKMKDKFICFFSNL